MPAAEIEISAYEFMNLHLSNDIDIDMVDECGEFKIERKSDDFMPYTTQYVIKIPDTTSFGFIYRDDANSALQNLITALNLNSERAAFIRQTLEKDTISIDYSEEEIEKYDIGTYGEMGSRIEIEISKSDVFNTYSNLKSLNRFSLDNPDIKEMNTIKSILLYETAIESSNTFIQHMMMYMSIETACLYDGNYLSGPALDSKMSKLTHLNEDYIKKWRDLYNRQKHVDTKSSHIRKTMEVIQSPMSVEKLRKAANQILKKRL